MVDYAQKWVHADMKTARHTELAASEEFLKDTEHDTGASGCLCSAFHVHASNTKFL